MAFESATYEKEGMSFRSNSKVIWTGSADTHHFVPQPLNEEVWNWRLEGMCEKGQNL